MKRINIIVEGETEEEFVNVLLKEPFALQGIYLTACRVTTNRKLKAKGGVTTYLKFKRDLLNWLDQDKQATLSMMFDLYALPDNFPGVLKAREHSDPYLRVKVIEQALLEDIRQERPDVQNRFLPYVQLHEFESLLFSHPQRLSEGLELFIPDTSSFEPELNIILEEAKSNPELINDSPKTAPSKRIEDFFKRNSCKYQKPLLGVFVTELIGLPHLRANCAHFNHWLNQLEQLESV